MNGWNISLYNTAITEASKSALIEVLRALSSYSDYFVLGGGWAPYYIIERFSQKTQFQHCGSIDIDLIIDPKLRGTSRYETIVKILAKRGYSQHVEDNRRFLYKFDKTIVSPVDSQPYDVSLDFITEPPETELQEDLNTRESVSPTLLNEHITGYQLRAGRMYSIDAAQYYPEEKEITPFNLNLVTPTVIIPIKGEAEIKGKYDILNFIIDCKSSEKTFNTFMAFRVAQRTQYMISEAFFNLRIKGQWGKVASSLIIFAIGVILTNISAQLIEIIAGRPLNLAVIGAAAIGAISSALGLFLLHRT